MPDRLNPATVRMNGQLIYSGKVWLDAWGTPHKKTDLNRPDSATGDNSTDRQRVNQPRYIQFDQ
ncbi:hypothetical protein [Aliiroseovarius pelagivivens]|uniref:hypothetical protein n=1 Tax=Aliiroseovarius pelagivivens TaxID=1639690 RepID=UPI000D54F7A6|nr:hypothetical protein [Aliiroseovarius pelagivivens]